MAQDVLGVGVGVPSLVLLPSASCPTIQESKSVANIFVVVWGETKGLHRQTEKMEVGTQALLH